MNLIIKTILALSPIIFSSLSKAQIFPNTPSECGTFYIIKNKKFNKLRSTCKIMQTEEHNNPQTHPLLCKQTLHNKPSWSDLEGNIFIIPGKQFKINKRPHHLRFYYHFWKKQPEENPHLVPDYRTKEAKTYLNTNIISNKKLNPKNLDKKQNKMLKHYMYSTLRDNLKLRAEHILNSEKERFDRQKLHKIPTEFIDQKIIDKIDETFAEVKHKILTYKEHHPKEQILFLLSTFPSIIQHIKDFPNDPMRPLLCLIESQKHKLKILKRYKKLVSFIISATALGVFIAVTAGASIPILAIIVGVLTSASGGSDFVINLEERDSIATRNKIASQMFDLEKNLRKNLEEALKIYKILLKKRSLKNSKKDLKTIIKHLKQLLDSNEKILMSQVRYNNLSHDKYTNKKNIINLVFGGAKILSGGIYIGAAAPDLMDVSKTIADTFHTADKVGVIFETEMISIIAQSLKNENDKEIIYELNEEIIKEDAKDLLSSH